jgi:Na+/H+ antiporter NhaD/arsenite permease-like protein
MLAVVIFCLAYLGIALGRIPGLAIDRVGVALIGAIAMVVTGVVSLEAAAGVPVTLASLGILILWFRMV